MKIFKSLTICAALMFTAILSGCNTVHGVGQDIQSGGKALSRAAH